ncbi:hypothetical protein ACJBU6_08801 [Exserohilum turcicum]
MHRRSTNPPAVFPASSVAIPEQFSICHPSSVIPLLTTTLPLPRGLGYGRAPYLVFRICVTQLLPRRLSPCSLDTLGLTRRLVSLVAYSVPSLCGFLFISVPSLSLFVPCSATLDRLFTQHFARRHEATSPALVFALPMT